MTRKTMWRLMAVLAVPGVVAACGGERDANAAAAESPAVTIGASDLAQATTATLRAGAPLSGSLEPKITVDVGAPMAEQLTAVLINEGDAVRQGQPLVRFRDDVLRAAALSARADLATARAAVNVAVAESTRAEALLAEGAIARRDRDNALLATEQARARLALAEAQLASAEDRAANATVTAPTAGVVSRRHAQAGDRIDFGKPLITIVNTAVLQLVASVEARWVTALRVGQPVVLTVANLATDTIAGRIARINPTADPATRQVRIYVDVPNRGNLVGGLFVSGHALLEQVRNVVGVPRAAIRLEGEERQPVAYLVSAGRVVRRPVTVGVEDADRGLVQVREGLAAGDTVIVGTVDVADGTRVEIAGTAPASGAAKRE
jgi:RND family efflux transporter MFP subunit